MATPAPAEGWYYLDGKQQSQGPFPVTYLQGAHCCWRRRRRRPLCAAAMGPLCSMCCCLLFEAEMNAP